MKQGKTFIVGLVLMLIFALAIKILMGGSETPPNEGARAAQRVAALKNLQAANHLKLETYAVVNRDKGTFQIPIDRAMELTVGELDRDHPHAVIPSPSPSPLSTP